MFTLRSAVFFGLITLSFSAKEFRFDYDFNELADGWLKFNSVPSTWQEARMRCFAEGAVLASPLTTKLKNAIINYVQRKSREVVVTIFSGVHATFSRGDYTSIEGVPLLRLPIKWAPGEPNNLENAESCLTMRTDNAGSMSDDRCDNVFPYVCYKKYSYLTTTACGTTDPGYALEPRTGSCYKFHRRGLPWSQAFMTCHAEGGHLAIINSEIEATVLIELCSKNPLETVIAPFRGTLNIGYHDWGQHSTFLTIHGETLTDAGYETWYPMQPDNTTRARTEDAGEFCGAIFRDGRLNDNVCNSPSGFICEKSRDSLLRF